MTRDYDVMKVETKGISVKLGISDGLYHERKVLLTSWKDETLCNKVIDSTNDYMNYDKFDCVKVMACDWLMYYEKY